MGNSKKLTQAKISGEIVCKEYKNLSEFINFVETSKTIKIKYKIPNGDKQKTFYRDVEIESLEKGEKDNVTGMLVAPVIFSALSLWYEENASVFDISRRDNELRWGIKWSGRFTSYSMRNIVYNNVGHSSAPMKIEIMGYIRNPAVYLFVNNKLQKQLKFDMILEENERIQYSSKANDLYIRKIKGNGETENLFDMLSLENDNFFTVPQRCISNSNNWRYGRI